MNMHCDGAAPRDPDPPYRGRMLLIIFKKEALEFLFPLVGQDPIRHLLGIYFFALN